jgi:hypothetical protein
MKRTFLTTMVTALTFFMAVTAQTDPKQKGLDAITMDAIKGQLEFLASDWTEGRATGEKGEYLAGDYVASMFKVFGVAPGGDPAAMGGARFRQGGDAAAGTAAAPPRSYFQNFSLIENISTGPSSIVIKKGNREMAFDEGVDYMPIRTSMTTKFEAPVVFVGYGINDKTLAINDFAGIDMKGKIIMRITGFPGSSNPESAAYKKMTASKTPMEINRIKAESIAGLEIAGIIEVTPGTDIAKRWGALKDGMNLSYAETGGGRTNYPGMRLEGKEVQMPALSIAVTERVGNFILQGSGIDMAKYMSDAEAGIVAKKPLVLSGVSAVISTEVKTKRTRVRNVVAMIEGENKNEFVVVGAHMDHMGMEAGKVWNGADDNASGTVGVLMIAKAVAATGVKPKKSIIFCAWTAEEKGLLGSEYFTRYPPMGKISDVKFYLNYDMIGRDAANDTEKNKAGVTYTKAYPKLEEWTVAYIKKYNINLDVSLRSADAPSGGSDYTAFTNNKIPIVAWMAAMHPEYHQPGDHISLINWEKMQNIIKVGFLQVWDAANNDLN